MKLECSINGDHLSVNLGGALTGDTASAFSEKVMKNLSSGIRVVTINLENVDYISSSGIGAVVKLYKDIQDRGAEMSILKATSRVKMLFELSGLTKLVPFDEGSGTSGAGSS